MYINGDKYIAQWDWNKGQGEINYKNGTKYISSSTTGARLNNSSGAATVSINKISIISINSIRIESDPVSTYFFSSIL